VNSICEVGESVFLSSV